VAGERAIEHHIGAELHVDALIAQLAGGQHGTVARWQLLARGVTRRQIVRRLEAGRLHEIHRGVYAVGHPVLSKHGHWMAAVLAGGSGTFLSHRGASGLWVLRDTRALEITSPRHLRRPGILTHRATLPPDEVTTRAGIPVTTAARTVFDMAAVCPHHDVEAAFHQAEFQNLTGPLSLGALVARYPGRRGTATIRRILNDARHTTGVTKSALEEAFLAFLDEHDLPRPHRNMFVLGAERDCVWPEHHLIVELDSWDAHSGRKPFESDRLRDRKLTLAEWRCIRVTARMLTAELARDLRYAMNTGVPTRTRR
jgi:hypothetical protein